MAEKLHKNMAEFGYDPDAEWEYSEDWIHQQTPGSHFGTEIQKTRRRDQASLVEAMSNGYTKEDPGPGGRFDYPEIYQAAVDRHAPENLENWRKENEKTLREGAERGESWAQQFTTPNTAKPGGYELNRWAHTPDREKTKPDGPDLDGPMFIETPGISPKWNDPMLGPGQIPPGEPGANHEFLPEETEAEYISRVVWPMYGGPEQIAWEDLPGVESWRHQQSPWEDPRVPWPSNVPRSPTTSHLGFSEEYHEAHGPAIRSELLPLPEGVHRRPQHQPILRQGREGHRAEPIYKPYEWE